MIKLRNFLRIFFRVQQLNANFWRAGEFMKCNWGQGSDIYNYFTTSSTFPDAPYCSYQPIAIGGNSGVPLKLEKNITHFFLFFKNINVHISIGI